MVQDTESYTAPESETIAVLPVDDGQTDLPLEAEAGDRIPFLFARRHGVLLEAISDKSAALLLRPGVSRAVISEVRRWLGRPLQLRFVDADEFDRFLQDAYETDSSRAMELMGDLGEEVDLSRIAQELPVPEDLLESEDDAPIIRLLNALFTEAVKEGASDIHIEPYEHRLAIRFRVDGVLRDVLEPPRVLAPLIVSRVKVMARLDIAEKRLPQDGRISLRLAGRAVDVRVSTLPSGYGERVVLRLLDKQGGRLDLEQLGMNANTRERIDHMIRRPHGIILVTGPTGSGKTTTLYAALSRINDRQRNIMTVEDPIEYYLDGISQTHVNTRVDLTFARGLRAILRQDPDVVMVGEIRDLETAEIAVQASLTGHLVFSTLHTNSAIGAVTRLRDMGVEPYLLASSLVGVVAQRLVRLLCLHCKQPYTASPVDCAELWLPAADPPTIFSAKGCEACNFLGYRGRTGIYELVELDDTLRNMIHDGLSEHEMELHARTRSKSIQQDGIQRVLSGETSLEEVLRVIRAE